MATEQWYKAGRSIITPVKAQDSQLLDRFSGIYLVVTTSKFRISLGTLHHIVIRSGTQKSHEIGSPCFQDDLRDSLSA